MGSISADFTINSSRLHLQKEGQIIKAENTVWMDQWDSHLKIYLIKLKPVKKK